jgi:predicted small secreted protein
MRFGGIAVLALLGAVLAGCTTGSGSGAKPRTLASAAKAAARPSIGGERRSTIVVVPEVMAPQGLGGVIGSPAAALTRRFGNPRLDLAEGDAHKLQFAGKACVLDIYLYPVSAGAAPTATHVEARLRQGGAPADPGACIREVEGR